MDMESSKNSSKAPLGEGKSEVAAVSDNIPPLDVTVLHIAYPSKQEVEHIKGQIVQQAVLRHNLQAQRDALQTQLDDLDTQLKQAENHALELNAAIAPIRRLPLEVLSIVLKIRVLENLESPWRLMRICRAWRAAVMLCKQLWNSLIICPSRHDYKYFAQSSDGRYDGHQVCYTRKHLLRALNRAGSTQLNIQLCFQSTYDYGEIEEILRASNDAIHPPRIATLTCPGECGPQSRTLSAEAFASWDFTPLKEFRGWDTTLLDRCVSSSTNLISLNTHALCLPRAGDAHILPQLECLRLYGGGDPSLYEMLSECQKLTDLELNVTILADGRDHLSPLPTLPQLERLYLNRSRWLLPIECPKLTNLRIGANNSYTGVQREVLLPCLKTLVYTEHAFCANSWLYYLEAPNLESLDAVDQVTHANTVYTTMTEIWTNKSGDCNSTQKLDPLVLKITGPVINARKLGRVLCRLTRCVELNIEKILTSPDIFEALCPVPSKKKKQRVEDPPLPALKVLSIWFSEARKTTARSEDVTKAARVFLKRRRAMGKPIERITARIGYAYPWDVSDTDQGV